MFLLFLVGLFNLSLGYYCSGGECRVTTHAFKDEIDSSEITYSDTPEIEEWHFHVYFFQTNNDSINSALNIQSKLLNEVKQHNFLAIFNGITNEIIPDVNVSNIPPINYGPIGPHPCGSYEVWVPIQYVGKALSWFMLNRNELTILLHPLSKYETEDHYGRVMFIGPSYRIDYTVLVGSEGDGEYPELQLGYEYNPNSPYAPQNWQNNPK